MKKFFYTAVLVTLLHPVIYGQTRYATNTDSPSNVKDSFVTNFVHIKDQFSKAWPEWNILGFVLKSVDSAGIAKWQSNVITPLDKDEKGYLIKANIPAYISKQFPTTWCSVVYIDSSRSKDTMMYTYGGINAGEIKLNLRSLPKGAETFLVPNRTWMLKVEKPDGKIDYETVERKYRVDSGPTEITVGVDETVFVVVFKLNGKYKTIIHHTKPKMVEPEQTVFVNF